LGRVLYETQLSQSREVVSRTRLDPTYDCAIVLTLLAGGVR
jgi:hypothetical protein